MPLSSGTRIGPYEVVAPLGAGGMGEVYRARDAKLQRDVAIKVLPSTFANDPERLSRFTREAQMLASLNHPHIAHVYGLEESPGSDGTDEAGMKGRPSGLPVIVMELVDGPTLADRIAEGPIPVNEAIAIARQVADALDAAHERGIVHRDLKPANIKLTADGTVKVLDFGLAKALAPMDGRGFSPQPAAGDGSAEAEASAARTFTSPAVTQHGVILGTAAYMSPEQARGKPVDKRADIWAFGVVLYEMLTGKVLFTGDTVSDTIAEVLKRDIDLAKLPPATPSNIERLIARCLEREPKNRLRDIADAAYEIEHPDRAPAPVAVARKTSVAAIATFAALAATGAAAATWMLTRPAPSARDVIRARYEMPAGNGRVSPEAPVVAISPNGQFVAALSNDPVPVVMLRRIDQFDWVRLAGTENATGVFFSPDSQFVGYWTRRDIGRIPVTGGTPTIIHRSERVVAAGPSGVWWADDGNVYFAEVIYGVFVVPAAGGPVRPIVQANSVSSPIVPRGSKVLLYVRGPAASRKIMLRPLDGGDEVELADGLTPRFLAPSTLLFVRGDALMAAPIDLNARRLTAEPTLVAQQIATLGQVSQYAVSDTGTLVYIAGAATLTQRSVLSRVSRKGEITALAGVVREHSDPRLSPDATQVVTHMSDQQNDVWLTDLNRGGALTRVTFAPDEDETPVWSPDGRWIAFTGTCRDSEKRCVYKRAADLSGDEQALWSTDLHVHVNDWSPDGSLLLIEVPDAERRNDVMLLPSGGGEPRRYLSSADIEFGARISPDGKWVVYMSNESGRLDVFLQTFPSPGRKMQVSTNGGVQPVWSRDGRELYFRTDKEIMAASITPGSRLLVDTPVSLFKDSFLRPQGDAHTTYDVFPDGSFLFIESRDGSGEAPPIHVVFNWAEEVKHALSARD